MSQAKPRRTKAEIEDLLQKWREGSVSVRRFCTEHGIAPASFYQWLSLRGFSTPSSAKAKSQRSSTDPSRLSNSAKDVFCEVQVTGHENPVAYAKHPRPLVERCLIDGRFKIDGKEIERHLLGEE